MQKSVKKKRKKNENFKEQIFGDSAYLIDGFYYTVCC